MALKYIIRSYSANRKKTTGDLQWDGATYAASSGPYGQGTIPVGDFTVKVRHVITGDDMDAAYCISDTTGKLCYFLPVEPDFETERDGFGIHPDGNVAGSEGCIVLPASA